MDKLADNKSNILLIVNSIILSVIIVLLLSKPDNKIWLVFPTATLLLTSLTTTIIAILAILFVPNFQYTDIEPNIKKVKLLFFGDFYKMNLDSYSSDMKLMKEERYYLYSTLIKEDHSQRVELERNFKLCSISL